MCLVGRVANHGKEDKEDCMTKEFVLYMDSVSKQAISTLGMEALELA